MNDLTLYKSENFGSVKCDFWKNENGEILMTTTQLGMALGFANPRKGISNLVNRKENEYIKDKDFSTVLAMRTPSGIQRTRVFNEDGVYEVTMIAGTNQAKKFRKWFRQILKGLRSGDLKLQYNVPKTYSEALLLASNLQKQLETQQPKVEMYNDLMDSDGLMNFKEVADSFGVCGRNTLFKILREERILCSRKYNRNLPYSQYSKNGYFQVKIAPRRTNNGVEKICTTLCTNKSLKLIQKVLKRKGLLEATQS